jgi:ribosomal protein S27E
MTFYRCRKCGRELIYVSRGEGGAWGGATVVRSRHAVVIHADGAHYGIRCDQCSERQTVFYSGTSWEACAFFMRA